MHNRKSGQLQVVIWPRGMCDVEPLQSFSHRVTTAPLPIPCRLLKLGKELAGFQSTVPEEEEAGEGAPPPQHGSLTHTFIARSSRKRRTRRTSEDTGEVFF